MRKKIRYCETLASQKPACWVSEKSRCLEVDARVKAKPSSEW